MRVIVDVSLYDLSEVHVRTKCHFDSLHVGSERIGGDLHAILNPRSNIRYKRFAVLVALAHFE